MPLNFLFIIHHVLVLLNLRLQLLLQNVMQGAFHLIQLIVPKLILLNFCKNRL